MDAFVGSPTKRIFMHLSTRLATRDDFSHMVRLCFPRSQSSLEELRQHWDTIWDSGGLMGLVVEDRELPMNRRALALMGCVFVHDRFLDECVAAKEPYAPQRLIRGIRSGLSPRVQEFEIPALNAKRGMIMYVVYLAWQPDGHGSVKEETLRSLLVNGFAEQFQGNNVRRIVGETAGSAIKAIALRTGCEVMNDYPSWVAPPEIEKNDLRPCLVGVCRETGMEVENYWFHRMFTYMPPRFAFTDSQRKVLLLARHGLTDVEIAADLGVTPDAVKKRWTAIYARVDVTVAGLLPESPSGGRGAEKKRALLAYLRDRPEELRPYSLRRRTVATSKDG